ncbi:MAG: aminodeoxychorismate/anthranilate synthase component II [Alphaproteobacteria bacterium GM7ARS4]|nr:aminodeoxychorismate/anthranilate synthase component II [Alphaproteobacteria bacterium GM7ARS4]
MFLLIDNYDSFTWNVLHYLAELGVEVKVIRHDVWSVSEIFASRPSACVISPGPCDPDKAGVCLAFLRENSERAHPVPVLGICLGHQALGQSFGGSVVRAPRPMHGKVSAITHDGRGLFQGIKSPFSATRYHSLIVEDESCPSCLRVTARAVDDHVIMALEHDSLPFYGVQFHPESIATEYGHDVLGNFVRLVGERDGVGAQG